MLLVGGLLPVASWIPGGHAAPWYPSRLSLWISGGAILLGTAVVAAIVLRRMPRLWRHGAWHAVACRWRNGGWFADILIAVVAGVAYAVVAQVVLSARPLLIDEVIQVWQARLFASGRLSVATPLHPEFTAAMHLVDTGARTYGQFPAGGPAMLALGALVGAEWLVDPVFAGIGVLVLARLLRWIEPGPGAALAAVLLAAFAPFALFLGGSHMNHVTTTTWLLGAALALIVATRDAAPRWQAAAALGACLGMAATIRPLDAASFALPTAAWLLWRVRLGAAHVRPLLASGVAIAIPLIALLAVNNAWTGHPFRFGYIELWGVTHRLGFHEAPWGVPHTPLRGMELINLYLLRLQTYWLETPAPGLLFATAALLMVRRLTAFDRWVLAGSALLLLSYFAYWHDGFYLGPRFLLPLAPWLALWTARLPAVLRSRAVAPPVRRGVLAAGVVALLIAAGQLAPIRWRQYQNGMLSMRIDAAAAARAAGVPAGASVLIRESWGAQLIARMWGLGVSRSMAEQVYRTTDSCGLDEVLTQLELEGGGATRLTELVAPLRADSGRLVAQRLSPDTTLRALPGLRLADRCIRRLLEDRAGTSLFAPLLVQGDGSVAFVRDLHARNALLGAPDRGAGWWLMTQAIAPGSPPRFSRVRADSAEAEWALP